MKILHVLNTNRFSGAENVACQIIGILDSTEGIQSVYCSPEGPIRQTLAQKNIVFAPMAALNRRELRRVIREVQPDVLHTHDMRAAWTAFTAHTGLPVISHIHNNAFDSRRVSFRSIAFLLASFRLSPAARRSGVPKRNVRLCLFSLCPKKEFSSPQHSVCTRLIPNCGVGHRFLFVRCCFSWPAGF